MHWQQLPECMQAPAIVSSLLMDISSDTRSQDLFQKDFRLFSSTPAWFLACAQTASYVANLPASLNAERVRQTAMAALLLATAAGQRRPEFSGILRAAVGLQAQCLACRSFGAGVESLGGSPATGQPQLPQRMHNLSGTMINATLAAQEAMGQLLLKQHKVG